MECTGERQFITITTKPDISSQYYSGKGYAIARNNPGNTVVPNFSNVQIEEGNEATEYEAYIDPSKVSVIRCGKNLLKSIATTRTIDGITFTVNTDKSVKANGKSTSTAPIRYLLGEATLPPGVYLISGQSEGTGSTFIMYSDQDGNFNQQHSGQDSALIVTKTATINVYLVVLESAMVSNIKIFPMIRLAPCTDKTYETYNGAEYTPSSNGTVEAITSLSPNMTILTDTEGAVVECEYIKDTNKVIEKLVNAITALGGNVTI